MKIKKFQTSGKITALNVINKAIDELSKKGITEEMFPKNWGDIIPRLYIRQHWGRRFKPDINYFLPSADAANALSDLTKMYLTKDLFNLGQLSNGTIKQMIIPKKDMLFVPEEGLPYMGGTIRLAKVPSRAHNDELTFPYQHYRWDFNSKDNNKELAFIKPANELNDTTFKDSVYSIGNIYNLGLVPKRQCAEFINKVIDPTLPSDLSREAMLGSMKAINLVKPYSSYLSGDFKADDVGFLHHSLNRSSIPMGAVLSKYIYNNDISTIPKLLQDYDVEPRKPLHKFIDFWPDLSWSNSGLSPDSYKLVLDVGNKGDNALRWGGWFKGFNALGSKNIEMIDAQKAFDNKEISPKEFKDSFLNWVYKDPKMSKYEPWQLIQSNYNGNDLYIRHPFVFKGFKNGGVLKRTK